MKPISYCRHARKRMKDRGVTEDEVDLVIKNPEYIEPDIKKRKNAYKYINNRFLRVTFQEETIIF
ncbi:MAG: DUF4258 domain-containing protein [bacterium]